MSNSNKVILIGLDGATFRILRPLVDAGIMPNVARLITGGASGSLMSTHPPVTCPAWPTMFTGVNPAKHGVFSFTCRDKSGGSPHTASLVDVKAPAVWELLGAAGHRVGVMNVPITFPAQPVNGFMLSGFPAPGSSSNILFPREQLSDLTRDLPGFSVNWPGVGHHTGSDVETAASVERVNGWLRDRIKSFDYFLDRNDVDFCFAVFEYPDKIQHAFYPLLDPACASESTASMKATRERLREGYRTVDTAIGRLVERFGPEANTMIVSDHGFGHVRRVVYLNHLLQQHGLFRGRRAKALTAKAMSMARVPLSVRAKLGLAQDEPWHRLDTWKSPLTNFSKSKAFAGHQYEHAVYINVEDRGDRGIVRRGDEYDAVCRQVVDLLRDTVDPRTGDRVFDSVFTASEVYKGEFLPGAPDVVFDLAPGYIVSSGVGLSTGLDGGFVRDARDGDVTGYHLPDGVFIGHGPAFRTTSEVNATLLDITPTVLALMGVAAPDSLDGRVITEAIHANAITQQPLQTADTTATRESSTDAVYSAEEEMEITRRLADLGYL